MFFLSVHPTAYFFVLSFRGMRISIHLNEQKNLASIHPDCVLNHPRECALVSHNAAIHHNSAVALLCIQTSSSNFHLLLITSLFFLTMTSISLPVTPFSPLLSVIPFSFFLVLKRFYFLFVSLVPVLTTSNHLVSLFDPCSQCLLPPSLTSLLFPALVPSVCLINHIFSSILSPLAMDCSISHRTTPALNPSHPVVVMVNSISHTPLTHPHQA